MNACPIPPPAATGQPQEPPPDDLIPEVEAAAMLKVQPQTLRSWRTYRGFPARYKAIQRFRAYALPAGVFYSRADVQRFINDCAVCWR